MEMPKPIERIVCEKLTLMVFHNAKHELILIEAKWWQEGNEKSSERYRFHYNEINLTAIVTSFSMVVEIQPPVFSESDKRSIELFISDFKDGLYFNGPS